MLTKKTMSQTERHFRMLEKAGFNSSFFRENTNTQSMLPKTNFIEYVYQKKIIMQKKTHSYFPANAPSNKKNFIVTRTFLHGAIDF